MNKRYNANEREKIDSYLKENDLQNVSLNHERSYFKSGMQVKEIQNPYNLVIIYEIEAQTGFGFTICHLIGSQEKINQLEKAAGIN